MKTYIIIVGLKPINKKNIKVLKNEKIYKKQQKGFKGSKKRFKSYTKVIY